jgi:membrane peptidoglycan carboxypeptidase
LASVDHSTGYIRALIGGRDYSKSTFNRILNMRRQVGSTFKPIVYLTAFQLGRDPNGVPYGPGHPIDDSPWTLVYDHGRQQWSPRNYEREFLGWISFRKALANSINTATARLGYEVGIPNVVKTARALGIQSDLPEVPSLSLGVAELTPIELLGAYATFANHGVRDELTVIRAITHEDGSDFARFVYHPSQIFPPGPVDLLTDMLTSVFTEGTAREAIKMGFDRPAAGKTGTTSHHRDAWFAGYTPQLTTVVWVGMDQPRADSKVKLTGANSALPIWVAYMKKALAGEPPLQFPLSPYLSNVPIDVRSGQLANETCRPSQVLTEKYEKDNEPQSYACLPNWPEPTPKTVEQ